jgi:hypothetical protein
MDRFTRPRGMRRLALVAACAALPLFAVPVAQARVTRIVFDTPATPLAGQNIPYVQMRGRAFGTLDPNDAHNATITDLALGVDPTDHLVHYETTFVLTMPQDLSQASGFLWHDVPNRGGAITIVAAERNLGDIGIASGWQADNAGATAVPTDHTTGTNHWVVVPMAKNADGSLVTGPVLGRIQNRSGPASQPMTVGNNPVPYLPASIDTSQAVLTPHSHETDNGIVTAGAPIASGDWAFAHCDAAHPFPGLVDDINPANLPGNLPVHICLRNGFDANTLYQVTYQGTNAYVLGVGIAAFRDVNSFFRYSAQDDVGTANPIAGKVHWAVIRGVSQSGNFTRQFIHLGFNQDEQNRMVHDGAWPIIAGRRVAADVRFGQPDGVLELYQQGSEGPQWWSPYNDTVRNEGVHSILDRCTATNTCPKVIEHFGGSEVFALKMTMSWVGTSANTDIALPRNVRRYYIPSTTHGGGGGGFNQSPANTPVNCPGNNYGQGQLRANPVSETEITNVLRVAMRNWLMTGVSPPPSKYPTLAGGNLVAPTQQAMGFPSGIPGLNYGVFLPENFIFPVFDYDWGTQFNRVDATGVQTNIPPPISNVITMRVPRVDADGNELGGVPTVLRDAPLGTYVGWNVTASGFHAGQVCNYIGGMIPFAIHAADRVGTGDPRLSLEERYHTHAGYVAAVTAAADNALAQGYLLQADHDALIQQAAASNVLQ